MVRPPCCDQVGIKKGPWTPEEDIILVSYIQEHGPGNWRSVPTNTGLLRCSKSCRLRWTNYLRPGIKRGNFTPHEEGMIIHLQALLGNKWAAIASYLPQRTDNDIKNYWNTHLKKKLKKFQTADQAKAAAHHDDQFLQRKLLSNRRRDFSGDITSSSSSSMYASSTENISRLLEGWMRSSPKGSTNTATTTAGNKNPEVEKDFSNEIAAASVSCYCPKVEQEEILPCCRELMPHEEFEAILQFDNLNNSVLWNKSSTSDPKIAGKPRSEVPQQQQMTPASAPPLSFLEKWLLDETTNGDQVGDIIGLPSIF